MDLAEAALFKGERHPWEVARVRAVNRILGRRLGANVFRALDLGCGDGYVSESLFGQMDGVSVALVDSEFTGGMKESMETHGGRFAYYNSLESVPEGAFDIIIMLDVLEHVEDDAGLLARVSSRLSDDGFLLVTVPAFQRLFCSHDRFLKHFRRYSRTELLPLAGKAGLEVLSSGYLFFSLILPRAAQAGLERLGTGSGGQPEGVSGWKGGRLLTSLIANVLAIDNTILLGLSSLGIRPPGLTVWMLCRKQR